MTPDTSAYMIGGYAVFFVVMAAYLVSLFLRQRTLRRDLDLLEQAGRRKKAAPARSRPAAKPGSRARVTRKSK